MKTTKIRQSARGEECTLMLPMVCNADTETTVLAHAPHPEKGVAHKGPDTWAAYSCSACHDAMDGRIKFPGFYPSQQEEQRAKEIAWFYAIRRTQTRLREKGLM